MRVPWLHPRSAYLHIPFCAHHCGYCDFAVAVGKGDQIERYLNAIDREMARLETPRPIDTLFLGGGTPTFLSANQLERLFASLRRWLILEPGGECSVEANPAGLTDDKIRVLAEQGVNRVSLGAQSFHPDFLRRLERDHKPDDVPRVFERLRRVVPAISLDLIFGVPGQTLDDWKRDLDAALALEPNHIATYGLTYEKGTRLWKQQRAGEFRALDEEAELALYELAMDRLNEAGFEQYEISNFARLGFRCRHNQVYWANHAHFGFGMGAARYVEGTREINSRDLETYLRKASVGENPAFQSEHLEPRERALETIAVQSRRAEGIHRAAFLEQTGFEVDKLIGPAVTRLVDLTLLSDDGVSIRLTRNGRCVADAVIAELFTQPQSG